MCPAGKHWKIINVNSALVHSFGVGRCGSRMPRPPFLKGQVVAAQGDLVHDTESVSTVCAREPAGAEGAETQLFYSRKEVHGKNDINTYLILEIEIWRCFPQLGVL